MGSWNSVWDVIDHDDAGNAIAGPVVVMDSRNSLVRSDESVLTAVVGLDDVIVVSTADAVLVASRTKAERVKALVEELSRRYGLVILDTPATLALPDAKIISELADGLVMVVRADVTPQEDVQAALDILDRNRILGVVLNGAQIDEHYYGY